MASERSSSRRIFLTPSPVQTPSSTATQPSRRRNASVSHLAVSFGHSERELPAGDVISKETESDIRCDQDLSSFTNEKFDKLVLEIKEELMNRNAATANDSLSTSNGLPDCSGRRRTFMHLAAEPFSALASNVQAEMSRRYPDPVKENIHSTAHIASPLPMSLAGHYGFLPRNAPVSQGTNRALANLNHTRRSQTSDITDFRTERRATPLGPRSAFPYPGTPSRLRPSPLRIQHHHPIPLCIIPQHNTSSSLLSTSDSECASGGTGVESDGDLPNNYDHSRDSTITRLQKALADRDKQIQDLTKSNEDLIATLNSRDSYIDMSRAENKTLLKMVSDLKVKVSELQGKVYPWIHMELRETEQDPSLPARYFLRDVCESDFHRQILLSARGDLAEGLLQLMQQILDDHGLDTTTLSLEQRNILRRLLIRLSAESGSLPPSFFVSDVKYADRDPWKGGSFSDIFPASCRGFPVALKRLRVFCSTSSWSDNPESLKKFYREAIVWRQLRHPSILPFRGVDCETFSPHLCMVSPWMKWGSIYDCMRFLDKQSQRIPFDEWLLDIAQGLRYIHGEQVIHGDVRGANILIDEHLHVRVADFGLTFFADTSTASLGSRIDGAARWMAPELLDSTISRPNYACDVYAFGCVCIEVYTRHKPFHDIVNSCQVINKVLQGVRPSRPDLGTGRVMSDALWALVQGCWKRDASDRPDMAKIVLDLESINLAEES